MSWSLGIDFGTSYTVAAAATDDGVQTVDVESNGGDRLPSAVFLNEDGQILVGNAAERQAKFAPERFEPTPKRALGEGELFLGDRFVPVSELVAAVLAKAYREACQRQGERVPDKVRITHPADWSDPRKAVLLEAAAVAQIADPQLIPEPVAAAVRIALQVTEPGRHIAVYDFGGGTFDAAVLLRTEEGFEVAGPPVGRDPLGGEDIDQRIIDHLGELLAEDHPDEWAALISPQDTDWRGAAAELRDEVQQAKETLSDVNACQLWIPGIKIGVQLTRDELEELIRPDIEATVDALESALSEAGVTPNDLAGLYLVGGSSRIPLVADTLWRRLGVQPKVQDSPKAVVAAGAAVWQREIKRATRTGPAVEDAGTADGQPTVEQRRDGPALEDTQEAPTVQARQPRGRPSATGPMFFPRVAFSHVRGSGTSSDRSAVQVLVRRRSDGATVQIHDTLAKDGTAELAADGLARWKKRTRDYRQLASSGAVVSGVPGGIERRFEIAPRRGPATAMLEQYLVIDDRALVITAPESTREVVEAITLSDPPPADGSTFHARIAVPRPADWFAAERLTVWAKGGDEPLIAEHAILDPATSREAWIAQRLGPLQQKSHAQVASRTSGIQLFGELSGELITVTWRDGRTPMVTRLGVAGDAAETFALQITVPLREPRLFGLADQFTLRAEGAAVATPA